MTLTLTSRCLCASVSSCGLLWSRTFVKTSLRAEYFQKYLAFSLLPLEGRAVFIPGQTLVTLSGIARREWCWSGVSV